MSTINILKKLQDNLIKQYNKAGLTIKDIEEGFGPGFANQYQSYSDDEEADVGNSTVVDTPYKTHFPIPEPKGKKAGSNYVPFGEAEEVDQTKEIKTDDKKDKVINTRDEKGIEATDVETDMSEPDTKTPSGVNDFGMSQTTGGVSDFGIDQEEEKTAGELGRIYELKKIYSRLTSIEGYLSNESNQELLEIRNYVSQAIELFEILSSNFNSYKDKLDEIIIIYYKFIMEVYNTVKKNYAKQNNSGD